MSLPLPLILFNFRSLLTRIHPGSFSPGPGSVSEKRTPRTSLFSNSNNSDRTMPSHRVASDSSSGERRCRGNVVDRLRCVATIAIGGIAIVLWWWGSNYNTRHVRSVSSWDADTRRIAAAILSGFRVDVYRPRRREPKILSSSLRNSVRKLAAENHEGVLNVHIVPHTHDDVGWRKTVEQYYYGLNTSIDERGAVHEILSTTVQALTENEARTFAYAEVQFFSLWWANQTDSVRDTVRYLIATKQFTFVNGGWCMHDEATSHFVGMIDQTTLGHQFLLRELGVVPVTGWQLDPFGHSATQASLLTYAAGMDALYFGRIDYQDLQRRKESLECEGLWTASHSDVSATVFWGLTGSYGGNYGPPAGFCFDALCDDEPLVGANSTRLLERVMDFLRDVAVQSNQTRGSHVMLTMGEDFTFKEAHIDFSNLDLLIGAAMNYQQWNMVDIHSLFGTRFDRVNVFYSNPDYYTEQKSTEASNTTRKASRTAPVIEWPEKTDDFFPYSDCPHCFWTGFFTSRAAFKRFERTASSFLLAARQIDALPMSGGLDTLHEENYASPLSMLEEALAVAQHHDAVSGTAKQHVADDYSKRLSAGMAAAAEHVIEKLKRYMLWNRTVTPNPLRRQLENLSYCPLLNETICRASMDATKLNDTVVYVIVYNPIAHNRSTQIHLPVASDASFRVERVDDGNQMKYQYIDAVASIPIFDNEESNENDVFRLVFDTGDLPPLGAVAFRITKESRNSVPVPITTPIRENSVTSRQLQRGAQKHIELNNGVFSAEVDISTGMLRGMRVGGTYLGFNQSWGYYESYDASMDSSDQNDQSSGAYIFRPKSSGHAFKHIIPKKQAASFVPISNGMEVHASFEVPWIRQVVRIVADQAFVEVEYIVGPISVSDGRGKEVVSRFVSSIESDGVFYTDSNGREFQKRKRDSRASWDLEVFEPIAGNYYPVNSAIFVEDSNAALTVLVDRSQGGSSLRDGSIELMVQRRTVSDDHRGVDEPLNETCGGMSPYPPYGRSERIGEGVVIRGKHRVLIGKGPIGASLARSALDETFAEPLVFVGSSPVSEPVIFETSTFAALQVALPINIMIVTFMRIRGRRKETFLLRLGHQFAPTEDENLSVPVDLDISNLFSGYNVTSVAETTLSGNAYWYDRLTRRHRWTNRESTSTRAILSDSSQITISPMEIRTFLIEGSEILEDSTRRRAFPDTRTAEMKTD